MLAASTAFAVIIDKMCHSWKDVLSAGKRRLPQTSKYFSYWIYDKWLSQERVLQTRLSKIN